MRLPALESCLGHTGLHQACQAAARHTSCSSLWCNDSVTTSHLYIQPGLQHSHSRCCPPCPGGQVLPAAGCWWQPPPCPWTVPSAASGQLATGGPPAAQAAPAGRQAAGRAAPLAQMQHLLLSNSACRPKCSRCRSSNAAPAGQVMQHLQAKKQQVGQHILAHKQQVGQHMHMLLRVGTVWPVGAQDCAAKECSLPAYQCMQCSRTQQSSTESRTQAGATTAGVTSAAANATSGLDCSPSRPALSVASSGTPEAAAAGTRALQVHDSLTSARRQWYLQGGWGVLATNER